MKSLKFKSLQLLSEREKKARKVEFHPKRNLILGMNHVGKSTVTKLIFETLGANPIGKLERWDPAAITLLTISIEDQEFYILRQRSHRAAFNSEGELIATASRDGEWAKVLASLTEFNLVLSDKNEKIAQADAACMFLPFYINQDGGWSGIWHTFNSMSRFRAPAKPIVEYFTQTLPPQFYQAKAEAEGEQREITLIEDDQRILNRTRDRLSKSLDVVGPQINAEAFEGEIKEITRQLTVINAKQESYRVEAVSLEEALASSNHQIALTTDALKRFRQDFGYLATPEETELVCPTCGAQYDESFLSILNFAEDARAVSEMLIRLQENRSLLIQRLQQCAKERQNFAEQYNALQTVLDVKRGELQFVDVVKSMGSGAAITAFDQEDRSLEESRNKHLLLKDRWERDMKVFRSAKRRKSIKETFQAEYQRARRSLNLPFRDVSRMQVYSRPDISGSGGPREVLAYYAAIWWVSRSPEFGSPFSVPVVVDCPAQSGQDTTNLPAMIRFISTGLPADAQILLTFEADVPDEFDKRIEFDSAFSLLLEAEYDQVGSSIFPKLEAMQVALLQKAQVIQPTLFNGGN
jgi:rubrerythrin